MEENEREGWGTILWEKWKFLWAVLFFIILDLGLVALWAAVLFGFEWLFHWLDPQGQFVILVVMKWLAELSTSAIVAYNLVLDVRKAVKRITYGPAQNVTVVDEAEVKSLPHAERDMSDARTEQQTTDRIPASRVP